ncbi:MAG TPA: O-antigen ligase family protein [Gemmatimonadaceae bacterium]|nr:O-antigen ligase family protein [Gemmatimonadaceae bacterium]
MTLRGVTGALLVAAAFVSSWNAVQIRGVQPGDLLLALALLLSAFSLAGGRMPWLPSWVKWASACLLLVLATHLIFPMSMTYMSQRFVYVPWFIKITGVDPVENGVFRAAKWLLAMTLLPALIVDASRKNPKIVEKITKAWMLGAVVSAFIAVTDLAGITSINTYLIFLGGASGRQAGLTAHPNHLGMSASMVVPIAIGVAMKSRWRGIPLILVLMLGAIVSGSRAGQAGFVLAVAATLALSQRARRFAPVMIVATGVAISSVVWIYPNTVDTAARFFRFDTTDKYVAQANEERADLSNQAIKDFAARPVDGVGLEVLNQAHNIYLQILAAGGLVLGAGFAVYFLGVLRAGYAERRSPDPLGLYLLVAVLVWIAAGTFGTQLTDRYLYFPVGALAALQYHRMRRSRERRRILGQMAIARRAEIEEYPALTA